MHITKIVSRRSRKLNKQMPWKKLEKLAKGLDSDGFMRRFFQTLKKSTILLLYKMLQIIYHFF